MSSQSATTICHQKMVFQKRYECNICGQPFSSMWALQNHIFTKHPEPTPLTNVISKYILPPKPVEIKPLPPKPRLRPSKAQKKKITSSDSWTVVGYSTAEHYNLLALSEKILEQVHA